MPDAFELIDPAGLRQFLAEFPTAVRRQSETLVQQGAVQDLSSNAAGRSYSAKVVDSTEHEVNLDYLVSSIDDQEGWVGGCTCGSEELCAHLGAVLLELLAAHNTSLVRSLSAGGRPTRAPEKAPQRGSTSDLAQRLAAAVGRSLNSQEKSFLGKLRSIFDRCRQYRRLTTWDLQELGVPLTNRYSWEPLEIWPELPENEDLFWQYVAAEARRQGVEIPAFMRPLTNPDVIREQLAKWRRQEEIQRWESQLKNFESEPPPLAAPTEETDLRVVIDPTELRLEWRPPGAAAFEPLKQNQARRLALEYEAGTLTLTAEAEWIWHALEAAWVYGATIKWTTLHEPTPASLGRLLRRRALESRVVLPSGEPLLRPVEPLRWALTPAARDEDDYELQLVQANGEPLPPILAVLPGNPGLYLTVTALFTGPGWQGGLNPKGVNRIPAPALETRAGVSLLQNLQLELPPRLRDRVEILTFDVTVRCELQPAWHGSKSEDCVFTARAEAPDGFRLKWSPAGWSSEKRGGRSKSKRGRITSYDRRILAEADALLQRLPLKFDAFGEGGAFLRVTKKFPEIFTEWLHSAPASIHVELDGELASLMGGNVAGRIKLDVTETETDWFDLRVVLDVSDTALTKDEIALLLKNKGSFVRLPGKGWRRLQFDLTQEEDERLARLGLSPRELSAEPQRLHALQLADEAARKFLPHEQVERVQRRAEEIRARVTPSLPNGVQAQLRPYQLEGFYFLAYLSTNRFGGILADDMGLGKTLQTLSWLLWLREQDPSCDADHPGEPALVVCPKSVMDNWRVEAGRFTPALRVRVWSSTELDRFGQDLATADLHVLNYSQLRALAQNFARTHWRAVILDEGQYIKNPNSQTAQVARTLRTDHRLILSGTPIENRLMDLWSLMAFAMPGVLGPRAQFARVYDAKNDPFARRRLASRVRPFLLRRTKTQVAKDLPDRVEEDLFCEMEGEQKALYQAELKRAQQMLLAIQTQKELAQQQFVFLVSLLRLRQICCDPRLLNPDSAATSAKFEALLEQLEPLMDEGHKVLVFSQFVELLDLLRGPLNERGWPVFYLAGHTENRGELVQEFQSAEGAGVFLISLKAGGFGLNLTAASYVVLFDPWWNPAVENQAIDRTHRIGQVNKVMAYRLLIKNSIEEKIRALQKKKQALAQDVLGEERFAQSLTLDDLRFLFAD